MRRLALSVIAASAVLAGGCRERPRHTEPMKLGGKEVAAEVLNQGHEAYMHYCYACHGEKGDGRGPSAPGMRPPPRDFTKGMFKFGGVAGGELPTDEDLAALIKNGLAGTPMLPWDVTEQERLAIVQYIKTFSERWKNEQAGERIVSAEPDPWQGREAEAVERGKKLYHLKGLETDPKTGQMLTVLAGCNTCHPSYMSKAELGALSQTVTKKAAEIREDPYLPVRTEGGYPVGDQNLTILAPDFLFHPVKNGTSAESLFRSIGAGIGGTAMPQWKGSIKDDDLWALAHYIKSLADMRGTATAAALKASLGGETP